jgi:chromosome segregation ATPase
MSDESTPQDAKPSDMELLRAEMRAGFHSVIERLNDHDKRFDKVDARLEHVDARLEHLDARLEKIDERLEKVDERLGGHDTVLVSLDTRIITEAEATRRHFDVVAEGLRESFKGVIDKTVATGKKVDRLIASNAVEHAAFLGALTDHEVRITRLETPPDSAPQA